MIHQRMSTGQVQACSKTATGDLRQLSDQAQKVRTGGVRPISGLRRAGENGALMPALPPPTEDLPHVLLIGHVIRISTTLAHIDNPQPPTVCPTAPPNELPQQSIAPLLPSSISSKAASSTQKPASWRQRWTRCVAARSFFIAAAANMRRNRSRKSSPRCAPASPMIPRQHIAHAAQMARTQKNKATSFHLGTHQRTRTSKADGLADSPCRTVEGEACEVEEGAYDPVGWRRRRWRWYRALEYPVPWMRSSLR